MAWFLTQVPPVLLLILPGIIIMTYFNTYTYFHVEMFRITRTQQIVFGS